MVICDYFPLKESLGLSQYRPGRIMYGSDFPNLPCEWDRELKILAHEQLPKETLHKILYRNASEFFGLAGSEPSG